jgi:arylsulfatase A-like enzyme
VHHGWKLGDARSWSEPPWRPPRGPGYFTERGIAIARAREAELDAEGRDDKLALGLPTEAPEVEDALLFDGQVAREAHRWIDALAGEPFFLAVGFKRPHLPFVAPARDWALHPVERVRLASNPGPIEGMPALARSPFHELRAYWGMPRKGPVGERDARELVRGYYACTSFVDRLVGELTDHLEQKGLLERTVVVLFGDNGYQLGEHGMWCKNNATEESTRVPLVLRLPRGLAPEGARGLRISAVVELVDLYPTLAELSGLPTPAHAEGTSLVPLFAEPSRPWKRAAFSQAPAWDAAERRWAMGYSMRTKRYRFTSWRAGAQELATELYDYEADPPATRNLAGDPAYAEVRRSLERDLARGWRGALPAPGGR